MLAMDAKFSIYKKQLSVKTKAKLHLAKDNATRRLLYKRIETAVSLNGTLVRELVELKNNISTVWANKWSFICCDYTSFRSRIIAWLCCRDRNIKTMFTQMVEMQNIGAKENGYRDYGEFLRKTLYERADMERIADRLYQEIMPLYREMFVLMRRRLINKYGNMTNLDPAGPVASSFIGPTDEFWTGLYDNGIIVPYPLIRTIDVGKEMRRRNYTVSQMYLLAEKFYTSIGFPPLPESFWNKSMLVKPVKRSAIGHPYAWDFYNESRQDVRISYFTAVTHGHLSLLFHEMGHVMCFLVYRNQPSLFRLLPNPGFHEAAGDVITLSFNTRKHLKKIGLVKDSSNTNSTEEEMNILMMNAVYTIPLISLAYVLDKWRWNIYSGEIKPSEYNRKWWEMKLKYQGLVPPRTRTEEDVDAAYLRHVAHDDEYFRYFVAAVVKFQFYKKMCEEAGHTGPVHRCDFYGSTKAGDTFKKMIELGASKPWWEALKMMTGQRDMSMKPLLEYFKPLHQWLIKQNAGETRSWMKGNKTEKDVIDEYIDKTAY